jgi:uncharacterized membrane protein YbhN (UPF0104 family)
VTDSARRPDVKGEDVPPGTVSRFRAVAGAAVAVVVMLVGAFAVYRDRHSFVVSFHRMGVWPILASFAVGVAAVAVSGCLWMAVLRGLGVDLGWRSGTRVFFTSQLGKYIPGSVWPVVLQMEAGRTRGASRRSMLAGNLISVALSCGVGLLVAAVDLPLADFDALHHYWWVLLAVPILLVALHPRVLPELLDRAFAALGRARLGLRLDPMAELRAGGWSLISWVAFGGHVAVLCAALGLGAGRSILLGIGGMALAVPSGVLFIPAPAGAGVRDVVLTLVLESRLSPGQALAVVVASRVLLVAADLGLALFSTLPIFRSRPAAQPD